jgi:hypothetical protein
MGRGGGRAGAPLPPPPPLPCSPPARLPACVSSKRARRAVTRCGAACARCGSAYRHASVACACSTGARTCDRCRDTRGRARRRCRPPCDQHTKCGQRDGAGPAAWRHTKHGCSVGEAGSSGARARHSPLWCSQAPIRGCPVQGDACLRRECETRLRVGPQSTARALPGAAAAAAAAAATAPRHVAWTDGVDVAVLPRADRWHRGVSTGSGGGPRCWLCAIAGLNDVGDCLQTRT